ncbi:MAG: HAD-IC family P-type ATPase [Gammaproteobacteria bacterium]|nr:HAD-IC family P-type ATPase [Gammaproteobacteria bacterium]
MNDTDERAQGSPSPPRLEAPWARDYQDIARALDVGLDSGLSEREANRRCTRYGLNRLAGARRRSAWGILGEQFRSIVILFLGAAAVLSFSFGQHLEGVAILVAIAISVIIGFVTEVRAVRSMEALRKLERASARVRRGGGAREVAAERLVPGDVLMLEQGDIVGADARVTEANKMQADESALTGESVPVGKSADPVAGDAALAERFCMLFKGTALTRGSGEAIVVATGRDTEIGRISELAEQAESVQTPLEKRLERLGHKLIWVTLGVGVVVGVSGILAGQPVLLMIKTAIVLAVAAIPEGLPIVATMALARGMWRMARRNALVNRLAAVETLGATSVILTDKTGTLTENRMRVVRFQLASGSVDVARSTERAEVAFTRDGEPLAVEGALREALELGVLCNNASLNSGGVGDEPAASGDPLEVALLEAGRAAELEQRALLERWPEAREEAFDPEVKMMATYHEAEDGYRVAVKGAPEAVLEVCTAVRAQDGDRDLSEAERERWVERNHRMAEDGLRVLALATKAVDSADDPPYQSLVLVALLGLLDPPREEVREALAQCREAGIRVVMVTGDQAGTALNIARSLELADEGTARMVRGDELLSPDQLSPEDRKRLIDAAVFARVNPEQKLDLIRLHQDAGSVVAMTGDGVNDAPALKQADIGVAMGRRGTQVAKEAADMVLKDDAFATIVAAIEHGRAIFGNIRKFSVYLLSGNMGEILAVTAASVAGAPLPLLPLQILYLNLVNDLFPALALGFGRAEATIMERPPRSPEEPVLGREQWLAILAYGVVVAFAVLGAFALALLWLGLSEAQAVTVAFFTLSLSRLWHVFNMRDPNTGLVRNEVVGNPYVWGALGVCVVLLAAAFTVPLLARVLSVVNPGLAGWTATLIMSFVPLVLGQLFKGRLGRGRAGGAKESVDTAL